MNKLLVKFILALRLSPATIDFVQEVLAALMEIANEVELKELKKAERSAELADLHLERMAEHRSEAARANKMIKNLGKV